MSTDINFLFMRDLNITVIYVVTWIQNKEVARKHKLAVHETVKINCVQYRLGHAVLKNAN